MRPESDREYFEGKKIVESLDPKIEKERLILYYINKQQQYLNEAQKKIGEYQEVFNAIDKFLPNHNPKFY